MLLEKILLYIAERHDEILLALRQHIVLSAAAVGIGLMISLAICIVSSIRKVNIDRLINFFSFLRLIPGVAMLVVAMPILGVGVFPAMVTLTLLTIPPSSSIPIRGSRIFLLRSWRVRWDWD